MEDSRILELFNARDESAIEEAAHRHGGLCRALALRVLGDVRDAEECVSEMLLAVWNSVPPQVPRNLEAYLVTLLRRAATDRLRSMTRLKRGGSQIAETLDELAEVIPAKDNVESEVDRRALTAALRSFLDGLPEASRQIFMERYYFNAPVRTIAERHRMQVSAVNVQLHRIRKKLKKHLEKEGFF